MSPSTEVRSAGAYERLRALPKAELHLHLEGAIPDGCMMELERKYGIVRSRDLRTSSPFYGSLPAFLDAMRDRFAVLREYEDFTIGAAAVAESLMAQGVIYAELHFSPQSFRRRYGLDPLLLADAIGKGLRQCGNGRFRARLIADLVRDNGPEVGMRLVAEIAEAATETGIVAIGLGGNERAYPAEAFAEVFRHAAARGLHRVAHAGEILGAGSVRDAVRWLGVERIGHGTGSVDDPALLDHLREKDIALEVCLSSNVALGVVDGIARHPLHEFLRAGVCVVLASDDPPMFGTDITHEFLLALETFGLNDRELRRMARAGFEKGFIPSEERMALLEEFDRAWSGEIIREE